MHHDSLPEALQGIKLYLLVKKLEARFVWLSWGFSNKVPEQEGSMC